MSHPALVPPPAPPAPLHPPPAEQLLSRTVSVVSVTQIKGAFHLAHVQLENGRFGDVPCDADVKTADPVGLYSRVLVRNGRVEARLQLRKLP
jgi:hypothetical protein